MTETNADLSLAEADWHVLARRCLRTRPGRRLIVAERLGWPAALWPTSQVISAALGRAVAVAAGGRPGPDEWASLDAGLRRFAVGDHYAATSLWFSPDREVYYDDNAWIALNLLETGLLQHAGILPGDPSDSARRAEGILRLLMAGQDGRAGGIYWQVGGGSRNACSTAPAGLVALRLIELDRVLGRSSAPHREWLRFATRCADFIESLRGDDGLIADNITAEGRIEPNRYSYNQGASIGLWLQLGLVTEGDDQVRRAVQTAETAVTYYGAGDRLWRESPAFVAIFLRHLAVLRAQLGSDLGARLTRSWLTRLTADARDPATGFYSRGGVGHYGGSVSLDQAGIAAARYSQCWPAELVPLLC